MALADVRIDYQTAADAAFACRFDQLDCARYAGRASSIAEANYWARMAMNAGRAYHELQRALGWL